MGFNIKSADINGTMWEVKYKLDDLKQHCKNYSEAVDSFSAQQAFVGSGADTMKTYLSEVHKSLAGCMSITAQGILDQFVIYQQGYFGLGEPEYFTLPQEVLETAVTTYNSYGTSLEYECERVRTALTNLSGIYSLGAPDITTIQSYHETVSTGLSTLTTNISTHEQNTKNVSLVDLENMIAALKTSVETYSSQGRTPINKYETGSFVQDSSVKAFAVASLPAISLNCQYKYQLAQAWANAESYTITKPNQREAGGIWQAVGGVVLVVIGVACIVGTAGAGTPIVLVAASTLFGGGTVLFGAAEITEGGQYAYYGSIGDMDSTTFNPVRDTVFNGDQEAYNNTKNVFVFAAGAMIPIGAAYSAGTLTLRSGAVIVGEELLSEGAGFLTTKAGEALNLDPTTTMLLGIVASMGTSAGMTKLDQAYNISGSFPKIDVTTTNPANMIDPSGSLATNASKTAKLSIEEAEELAFNAVHGPSKSDIVVLGKFDGVKDADGNFLKDVNGKVIPTENSYNVIAQDVGAQYFQLDNWDDLASKYEGDEIWKINERYLDIQTSSGREIYLTNNPDVFRGDGSSFAREIEYLDQNGYTFVKEGDFWHAIR